MTNFEDIVSKLQNLHLGAKSAISLKSTEEEYVLHIATQNRQNPDTHTVLAASCTNYCIRLFSRNNLASTQEILAHEGVISGLRFARTDPNLLWSSSWDKSLRCWDLRQCTDCVQKLDVADRTRHVLMGFDINATDRLLCAGTEANDHNDVYLLFWDTRKSSLLGCYSESHQDDITQVCFHPSNSDRLATSSIDGLVCLFDVSETTEDEALQYTLNSQSTVACVGWCKGNPDQVYCITHIGTFHVWDAEEGDVLINVLDLKEKYQGQVEFLVDYIPSIEADKWLLLSGTHSGDLHAVQLSGSGDSQKVCSLTGGHSATVRALHWDQKSSTLVTGGEDSLLCLWSAQAGEETSGTIKMQMKIKRQVMRRAKPF